MKVYRVFVLGTGTDGFDYEDTKGIFTSKEKAEKAIEYGKSTETHCYSGGHWHCLEYECDMYDDFKKID